jgi:hypothetical protein
VYRKTRAYQNEGFSGALLLGRLVEFTQKLYTRLEELVRKKPPSL